MLLVRLLPRRFKDFLSNITYLLRSKSNPTPQRAAPVEQRIWKKPLLWIDITTNNTKFLEESSSKGIAPLTLGSEVRGSFMSAFWNCSSAQPSQFSHLRSGSQQLESAMSNYSDLGIAVTRPLYYKGRDQLKFEQVEMLDI